MARAALSAGDITALVGLEKAVRGLEPFFIMRHAEFETTGDQSFDTQSEVAFDAVETAIAAVRTSRGTSD